MYKFCSSPKISKSGHCIRRGIINHSWNGGEDVVAGSRIYCLVTSSSCSSCSIGN